MPRKLLLKNLIYLVSDGNQVKLIRTRPRNLKIFTECFIDNSGCPDPRTLFGPWWNVEDTDTRRLIGSAEICPTDRWWSGGIIGVYDSARIQDLNSLIDDVALIKKFLEGLDVPSIYLASNLWIPKSVAK